MNKRKAKTPPATAVPPKDAKPATPPGRKPQSAEERWKEAARKAEANNPFADRGSRQPGGGGNHDAENVNPSLSPASEKGTERLTPFFIPRIGVPKGRIAPFPRRMLPWQAERLRDQIRETTAEVLLYADGGDMDAVALLVDIAGSAIGLLRGLAERQPELIGPYARKCTVWPDFIGNHPGARKWNKWLLAELEIGTEAIDRGNWKETSPATQAALAMFTWLQLNQTALKLRELTQVTRKRWFDIGWHNLLVATKGRPDEDEFLAQIGRSAVGKKSTSRGMSEQTPAMKRDDVIAKIKELVWKSFQSVTRHSPHATPV